MADRQLNHSAKCLLELPYALKMELISRQSLEKLREKQLPNFGKLQQKLDLEFETKFRSGSEQKSAQILVENFKQALDQINHHYTAVHSGFRD
jgi:hypothetical protein